MEQWKYRENGYTGRMCCYCERNSGGVYLLFVYDIMGTEFIEIRFAKTRNIFYFCVCTAEASNWNNNFVLTLCSLQMVYEWELYRLTVLHDHSLPLFAHTKNSDGLSLSKLIAAVLTKKKCFPQICWHVSGNKKK